MYICNCPELRLEDGRTYREGEPVPEVDSWPEPVRQASLDRKEIRMQDGHPRVSVLSPEQIVRRNAAPPWLLKEASRGRILPLEPGPSERHHQAPAGSVTLSPGQGPALNTRQVDEADPVPAPKPEPRTAPKAAEPEAAEQPRAGGRNRRNGRR